MPPFVPSKRRRPSPTTGPQPPAKRVAGKKTLFDEADATATKKPSLNQVKQLLQTLDASDDDSSSDLSDADSDDFEDALPASPTHRKPDHTSGRADSEDDMDWEDAIPSANDPTTASSPRAPSPSGDLQLVLDHARSWSSFKQADGAKKGPSKIERQIRIATHGMHVQALMLHNAIRNAWATDAKVKDTLRGHFTPGVKSEVEKWRRACGNTLASEETDSKLKTAKGTDGILTIKGKDTKKDKANHKTQRDWGRTAEHLEYGNPDLSRGDPTIRLLKILAGFWRKRFEVTAPGLRKQGYKDLERLQSEIRSSRNDEHDPEVHGERVASLQEFRVLAERCQGSRDVGAQLFTALIRSLGLQARLVANLQPAGFGWSKSEEANPAKPPKANGAAQKATSATSTTKKTRPPPKQAKKRSSSGAKDQPINLSSSESPLSSVLPSDDDSDDSPPPSASRPGRKQYDRNLPFPIYWTEVLSPISHKWIPVDPIVTSAVAVSEEQLVVFEPRGAKADKAKQVIAYVVGHANDGTAKELTTRYLKRHMWPGKTKGVRMPVEKIPVYNRRGKIRRYEDYDFFKRVMSGYKRHDRNRTAADDIEDSTDLKPAKVERAPKTGGEETLQGYKSSAEFVLERHLRREEALLPEAKPVKSFLAGKGDKAKPEPVYLRKDVVTCRTAESWHKEGREVRPGSQPLKRVPARAVTLMRKREIEEAERDTGEKMLQPLYSRAQTDWIVPPPIENGVIPRNAFGNMDVYVPSMVPKGAVHVRLKGSAKICRQLGIDYAEACTGFEFGNKRAVPVLTGVVVAAENKRALIDAWHVAQEEKRKKERAKREKIALDMWKRMIKGLRIVEHLQHEYGDKADSHIRDAIHPMSKRNIVVPPREDEVLGDMEEEIPVEDKENVEDEENNDDTWDMGGGFVRDEDEMDNATSEVSGGFVRDHDAETDMNTGEDSGLVVDGIDTDDESSVLTPEAQSKQVKTAVNGVKRGQKVHRSTKAASTITISSDSDSVELSSVKRDSQLVRSTTTSPYFAKKYRK